MSLSVNQKKRISELKKYLLEIEEVEKTDFNKWFRGKKQFSINIGTYLILIEDDA